MKGSAMSDDLVKTATARAALLHASAAWGSDEDGHLIDRLLDRIEALQAALAQAEAERDGFKNDALAALRAMGLVFISAEVVEDLCSELEAEVKDRWDYNERLAHKLERDMATVVKVRAMLAVAQGDAK